MDDWFLQQLDAFEHAFESTDAYGEYVAKRKALVEQIVNALPPETRKAWTKLAEFEESQHSEEVLQALHWGVTGRLGA